MERLVELVCVCSGLIVPLIALWAVTSLYTLRAGKKCCATESAYFVALLLIAGITLRTVTINHDCWLVHTLSLGVMIVAGVMRRPAPESDLLQPESELQPY